MLTWLQCKVSRIGGKECISIQAFNLHNFEKIITAQVRGEDPFTSAPVLQEISYDGMAMLRVQFLYTCNQLHWSKSYHFASTSST